ncbi:signal peptidase I [Paenibacillus sp. PL2-23]|uniref:signal peptidase I n=1 Tax=Paenibacillus sp. PL2-23 TaxID=2100729 RepID=UPI0030F9792D
MDSQHRNEDEWKTVDETKENGSVQEAANDTPRSVTHQREGRAFKEIVEWIKALVIAVLLVFVIRQFLFSPFIVDGDSMQPNFETSERLIVNKILYDIREPQFGEVVVFDVPEQGRKFIKRVIGVPGDQIRLDGDDLYINDVLVEEPYIKEAIEAARARGELYNTEKNFPNETVTEKTVPEGMIFVLGDNRGNSTDSRVIGFVKDEEIVGRADVIFWPLDKISFIKHRY